MFPRADDPPDADQLAPPAGGGYRVRFPEGERHNRINRQEGESLTFRVAARLASGG